ncbi:MAG: nucleotidyltransferase domain-containing protein [Thermotogae bacterium]|uniref:Polymerase nucleotidyl transferase domain-containing protein n=1 Tax=Kosmotoga pacifica TaxID=1330330 RepID=A0A0G2Z8W6_9BACT|nr:nucleotidyltransferase domain-containing protein [Kosmotoga pacifica]AKI98002.1 hypothetical protein IX53_09390 [Kosmotoga pacifica]RKX47129.1 MAG: nucleotidyltransferase domain-containing protein [Thermotogota bacterium]
MEAIKIAKKFIEKYYTNCLVAFLSGSVVRGEGTPTSDLDIVVILKPGEKHHRRSFIFNNQPIEVFANTEESIEKFFKFDVAEKEPSLPQMCSEGIIIRDTHGLGERIKERACELLAKGPGILSKKEIDDYRYSITDLLDDFSGSTKKEESIFIVERLVNNAVKLHLLANGQWVGKGKWLYRALKSFDPDLAKELVTAMELFFCHNNASAVIELVDRILAPFGGRLFEGYYRD